MKTTINFWDFCDAFRNMNRTDNFSYAGKQALFDYLEEYEESCDIELELDVIALCCEYSEYDSAVACIEGCGYDCDLSDCEDDGDRELDALDYLYNHTTVIQFLNGIIIQDF